MWALMWVGWHWGSGLMNSYCQILMTSVKCEARPLSEKESEIIVLKVENKSKV